MTRVLARMLIEGEGEADHDRGAARAGPRASMTSARIRMNIRAARMTMAPAPALSTVGGLVQAAQRDSAGVVLHCCSRSPVKRKNAKLIPVTIPASRIAKTRPADSGLPQLTLVTPE